MKGYANVTLTSEQIDHIQSWRNFHSQNSAASFAESFVVKRRRPLWVNLDKKSWRVKAGNEWFVKVYAMSYDFWYASFKYKSEIEIIGSLYSGKRTWALLDNELCVALTEILKMPPTLEEMITNEPRDSSQ